MRRQPLANDYSNPAQEIQASVLVQYISDTSPPFLDFLSTAPGTEAESGSPGLDVVLLYYIPAPILIAQLSVQKYQSNSPLSRRIPQCGSYVPALHAR